ncbi:MAG: cell division protein FtsL [Deltaproteobacteria bacterium]|nr:cell division protein FtsL [Deltaproteobacteria bacterium]
MGGRPKKNRPVEPQPEAPEPKKGKKKAAKDEPRKRSSARFVMLWTAAVLATAAAFVVHLSMRFETVRLGYDVGAERREQRRLVEQKRLLSLEAATLREAARVEAIARGALKMKEPEPERVIAIGGQQRQARTAGRVR